ncbi:MAG: hypothetical protein EOP11_01855 [Proteobacteria bacterium]|nr:MAG: hypothetical protein EOP11_01855 [Pseudomonadota bacterium]
MKNLTLALFINGAGAVTLLAFSLFLFAMWDWLKPTRRAWREWGPTLLISVLGAAIAYLSVSVDFKVLSDETNLLSVANMLTQFGKASNTEMWVYYYNTYHALDVSVPTRPLLFPLLTSLVHAINGMRWWSPFLVNFACLTGIFFLSFTWAKQNLSKAIPGAYLIFLGLSMSPVLIINATSAGFDVCSLFFGFLAALLFTRYFQEKAAGEDRAALTLRALVFTLVCFASVRYESIVALAFVGLAIHAPERFRKMPWSLYATAGFLLLPLFVARYLTWGQFENPPGVAPFALEHFVNHLGPFVTSFFLDPRGPYPILLHWLGLVGTMLLIPRLSFSGRVILAYMVFLWALLLSHHFGFAGHPTQARLFLPVSFGLSLMALYLLSGLERYVDRRGIIVVFVILAFHHHQFAMGDPLMTQLTMTREVRHIRDFLDEDAQRGDLYVYERPGQLTALGFSTISFNEFKAKQESYLENIKRGLYRRLIVISKADFAITGTFNLRRLRTHMLTPSEELRISVLEFAPWIPKFTDLELQNMPPWHMPKKDPDSKGSGPRGGEKIPVFTVPPGAPSAPAGPRR